MKKIKFKKKSFILLEILIAVTLLTLLSIPLIRNPIYFYKKEMETLKKLAIIKLENDAFLEIKEMLYKNQIGWDEFSMREKPNALIKTLNNKRLIVKPIIDTPITVYYRLWTKREKLSKEDILCRSLNCEISINKPLSKSSSTNKNHIYKIYVQKEKLDLLKKQ